MADKQQGWRSARAQQLQKEMELALQMELELLEANENASAIRLQAVRRGQEARRAADAERAAVQFRVAQDSAVVVLQTRHRGQHARRTVNAQRIEKRQVAAVTNIQAIRRGQRGRRTSKGLQQQREHSQREATRIQAINRGHRDRRAAQALQQDMQRAQGGQLMQRQAGEQASQRNARLPSAADLDEVRFAPLVQAKPAVRDSTGIGVREQLLSGSASAPSLISPATSPRRTAASSRFDVSPLPAPLQFSDLQRPSQVQQPTSQLSALPSQSSSPFDAVHSVQQSQRETEAAAATRLQAALRGQVVRQAVVVQVVRQLGMVVQVAAMHKAEALEATERAMNAEHELRFFSEHAQSSEMRVTDLTEQLTLSENSVKVLALELVKIRDLYEELQELYFMEQPDESTPYAAIAPPPHVPKGRAGRNDAARRLPKIGGGEEQATRQDSLRVREEGFVAAFPDYGYHSRSGLRVPGRQRIQESHEENARRQHAARRRKHRQRLPALTDL